MKKLLLLGGSRYLLPVIREAKELGLYTITCDYLLRPGRGDGRLCGRRAGPAECRPL